MKKLLLFLSGTVCLLRLSAQQANDSLQVMNNAERHHFYLNKSQSQRTIGWVCLSGGIIMGVVGLGQMANNLFSDNNKGEALTIAGACVTVISVPLFIASGRNRRKAQLALSGQSVSFLNQTKTIISLGMTIPLGK
jgi:hypothetical protein